MYRLFYIILKVWSRFSFVQRYSAKLPIISGSFFHWKNKPFTFSFYISSNSRSSRKTRYLVARVNKFIINHWLSIIIFLLTRLLFSNETFIRWNETLSSNLKTCPPLETNSKSFRNENWSRREIGSGVFSPAWTIYFGSAWYRSRPRRR